MKITNEILARLTATQRAALKALALELTAVNNKK